MQPLERHQAAALTAMITALTMLIAHACIHRLDKPANFAWTIAFVLVFVTIAFLPTRPAYLKHKLTVLGPVTILAYLGYDSPRAPAAFKTVLSAALVLAIYAWCLSMFGMFVHKRRRAARRNAKALARAYEARTAPTAATVPAKRPRSRYA